MAVNKPRTNLKTSANPAKSDTKPVAPPANPVQATGANALDNLIHERTRLSLVSALAAHSRLSFTELKELLQLSDGNLSVQARKLEEAGYVHCEKRFVGRTPRTEYALTDTGRAALQRYVAHMEALIRSMRQD